jgi:ribosome biogenesis GTPase / thiamine phosphate phosphatase
MRGLVVKSTGSIYKIRDQNGLFHECRLKGSLRQNKSELTNPVAVGDWVEVDVLKEYNHISIIYPRDNYVLRKSNNLSKRAQIIASNIDQVLLIVTISQPRTSFGFIDRYLAICEIYGIEAILLFNKFDVYNKEEKDLLDEYVALYKKIGYKTLVGSVFNNETIKEIRHIFSNKKTLLAGHSGVGKSTWLNVLVPDINQKRIKKGSIPQHLQKCFL